MPLNCRWLARAIFFLLQTPFLHLSKLTEESLIYEHCVASQPASQAIWIGYVVAVPTLSTGGCKLDPQVTKTCETNEGICGSCKIMYD